VTVKAVIEDNMTDGAVPVDVNISVDEYTGKVRLDFDSFSILVPREPLEMVMYEDLHG
jgi:hypothetical protein